VEAANRVAFRDIVRLERLACVARVLDELEDDPALRVLDLQDLLPEALIALGDLHTVLGEMLAPEPERVRRHRIAHQANLASPGPRLAAGTPPRKNRREISRRPHRIGEIQVIDSRWRRVVP
jgi:hypothetical protein